MLAKLRPGLMLLFTLLFSSANAEEKDGPSLEMLSFIANFASDDEWIDPMQVDNLLSNTEANVEENQDNE